METGEGGKGLGQEGPNQGRNYINPPSEASISSKGTDLCSAE